MAKGYNKEFVIDLERFAKKAESTVLDVRKNLAYELFKRIVNRTPVYFEHESHSGTTRNNWKLTIGTLNTSIASGTDKKGNITKARASKILKKLQGDETIYISNSVPWIFHLEDGLYSKNPSVGSYNTQTKQYEVRTINGFSTQAPRGMVKVTLAEYPDIYRRAIRKARTIT
jgi:hypothetical protein